MKVIVTVIYTDGRQLKGVLYGVSKKHAVKRAWVDFAVYGDINHITTKEVKI